MARKRTKWQKALDDYAKEHGDIEQGYTVYNTDRWFAVSRKPPEYLTKKQILIVKILFWHDYCNMTFTQLAWECKRDEKTIRRWYKEAKILCPDK